MAFQSLLSHANVSHKKFCKLEIRLDNDFIFLRGAENETPDSTLSGAVVFMTTETLQSKGVSIEFLGKRRTMHFVQDEKDRPAGAPSSAPLVNKATFLAERQRLTLHGDDIRTLKPGNHEIPFSFKLPGNISESIEGLSGNFVSYGLKATVDRGIMAKDIVARKHVRIIRTLGDDPVEYVDPQQVSGLWPDKLKYEFATSSRAAIFGTKVVTNIELTPLIEKLRIGKIRVTLKEQRKVKVVPGPESGGGMWKTETPVKEQMLEIPEGSETQDPELQLPMYKFKSTFELPKSLTQCRQSVENNPWIRIKHTMYYDVLLHNPDGHLSELRAHHAIRLFISPNLPVGEDNNVADAGIGASEDQTFETLQQAPPEYSHHRLDPLYDGIHTAGFMTPFSPSGGASPGLNFSRRGSRDDISTLNQAANDFHENLTQRLAELPDHHHHENELTARLRELQMHQHSNGQHSPHSGGQSSSGPTRNNSFFELSSVGSSGVATPGALRTVDYDSYALSRMPSYDTAVRSSAVRAPITDMPPSYEVSQSRPPSPSAPHRPPLGTQSSVNRGRPD